MNLKKMVSFKAKEFILVQNLKKIKGIVTATGWTSSKVSHISILTHGEDEYVVDLKNGDGAKLFKILKSLILATGYVNHEVNGKKIINIIDYKILN